MPEFAYTDLLPVGPDTTQYRLLTADGVRTREAFGRKFLEVDPALWTTRRPHPTTGSSPAIS